MRTSSSWIVVLALASAVAASVASAEGKKAKPLKSDASGAEKHWMCKQLTDAACDVAKRCDDPSKSLRHCKRARARCDIVSEGTSDSATEDDVQVCGQAISDISCKEASFDNEMGVNFDIKRLTACVSSKNDWLSWSLVSASKLPKSNSHDDEKTEGREHENSGEVIGGNSDSSE